MTRSHVWALLGGLGVGIGVGVIAVLLILNRVESVTSSPVAVTAPASVAAPQAATGATPKPIVHTKPRRFTGAKAPSGVPATADSRRTTPAIQSPATNPIGSGGTIFSGADTNDPRVQHFLN